MTPGDKTPEERLQRIETQNEYMVKRIDEVADKLDDAESARIKSMIDFSTKHQELLSLATVNERRICSLEGGVNAITTSVNENLKNHKSEVKQEIKLNEEKTDVKLKTMTGLVGDLNAKISPLLFAHKILVWVAAAFGISVIGLIWALLTHSVEIIHP